MALMAKTRNYSRDNTEAARMILAHPTRYDRLLLIWAELWTARHGTERKRPVSASMADTNKDQAMPGHKGALGESYEDQWQICSAARNTLA